MRKAFISPSKYIQADGALNYLGDYISLYGKKAFLIAHKDDSERVSKQLNYTKKKYKVDITIADFNGECSRPEINRLKDIASKGKYDVIVGLGGGKALDTSKCVADNLLPVIVCPTIAATDAPTSSSAVVYHPDGTFDDYAYFKINPNIILVDTGVIAKAPVRFLVSGMGDALATYFETRATRRAFGRVNASGYKKDKAVGTKAAMALSELCFETLLEDGYKAYKSCREGVVTPALENIVEANILLSGLGFESGGLAAAHAVYNGMTVIPGSHKYTHGEKVAFGTLVQLVLENAPMEEIELVLDFSLSIGLPVCLKDLEMEKVSDSMLMKVAKQACIPEESIHNMPFPVTPEQVVSAIKVADKLGSEAAYNTED